MRKLFGERAVINAAVQEDKALEAVKYKDYFDYAEPVATIPSHRILAIPGIPGGLPADFHTT